MSVVWGDRFPDCWWCERLGERCPDHQEPRTLAEALGADPAEVSELLRREFERIRQAEREAHIAALQIWLGEAS